MADDAGALLVRSGLVTTSALEAARANMSTHGGTIGEQLVVVGAIGDESLTEFYQQRLLVPRVNPNTLAKLPAKVVQAIPLDVIVEHRAIPVSLDNDNNLTVAMSDPSDRRAVDEIAFVTGSYVVRAVATQMQIAWCLAHYYGHVTLLGQRLLQASEPAPSTSGPLPASSGPLPRQKGLTAEINATRHRGMAPVTSQQPIQRPAGGPIPRSEQVEVPAPAKASATTSPGMGVVSEESDGVPGSRPRSVSGEIRVPRVRAQSIKPEPPEGSGETASSLDESGPTIITVEVDEEIAAAASAAMVPVRRRKAKTDPPELAARGGEIEGANRADRRVDDNEPRIIIAEDATMATPTIVVDEDASGVVIHEGLRREDSEPVLLDRKRPSQPPESAKPAGGSAPGTGAVIEPADDADSDVVELVAPKRRRPSRPPRQTQVGIGAVPAPVRAHRDTDVSGTEAVTLAVETDEPTAPVTLPPEAVPAVATSTAPPEPPKKSTTMVGFAAAPILEASKPKSDTGPTKPFIEHDDLDDGWGPPGTTIPPPLLGAMPGSEDAAPQAIPLAVDSAPLLVAPPNAPENQASRDTSRTLARTLEDSMQRALELITELGQAQDRDTVVSMLIEHLAATHQRAGFFSLRPNRAKVAELSVFAIKPAPPTQSYATLPLDKPSTLQDVVGTRLPYRGPTVDDASQTFLATVLGAAPAEILLVPVAVRERVVGVLFGEHRHQHTFDDQLALVARAAGLALERIMKSKR